MRYLNENNITVSVTYPNSTALPKGLYQYRVREWNERDQSRSDTRIVFAGNFYANGSERIHTFDITDIVRNDVEVFARNTNYSGSNNVRLMTIYFVQVYTGSAWVTSNEVTVSHVYGYPNFSPQSQEYMNPSSVFFDISTYTKGHVTVALQGFNRYNSNPNNKCALIPRYPLYEDDQYMFESVFPFGITVEHGRSVQALELRAIDVGDGDVESPLNTNTIDYLGYEYMTSTYMSTIGQMVGMNTRYTDDIALWLVSTSSDTPSNMRYSKVALFERCYSRYYLFWQDRLGSFQSQPFSERVDFSEDIKVDEVQNYMNIRRRGNVTIQPKWKITTGWIKESLYPFYESLYVSPILKLIDTKYDKVYDVIFKGNYVEKNNRNQKKLINLTIDLEQTNTQNILY